MDIAIPSTRARIVEARSYLRPLDEEGTVLETPDQAIDRVITHQRWLWERQLGRPLNVVEEFELTNLRELLVDRKLCVAGRTRWLGGTEVARKREASQFNCAFLEVRTVHDVVDVLWLLLQGCGVGFRMVPGILNGFAQKMEVEIMRTRRAKFAGGLDYNTEDFNPQTGIWTIRIGDSSAAWAKSIGKILAGKHGARKLVIDFREVRGPGGRLKGYGWISSGDEQIARAYEAICRIMNARAGQLLSRIDLLDILNWLGMTLSSRRSAEIALLAYGEPEWEDFAVAKKDHMEEGRPHRGMSNNSLIFYQKPTKYQLNRVFKTMLDSGGSEPGFINGVEAQRRAPWFKGVNPCGEILLGDKSFCNLVEVVLPRFNGDDAALNRAVYLAARANYRQTCVDLRDGVLQEGWHQLNEFLRLCGVGVTGVVAWDLKDEPDAWLDIRASAYGGANSMADALGTPRPKAITTVKPSGTASKTCGIVGMEIPEGVHMPKARFIFNNVRFSEHDPLLARLRKAGYHTFADPYDPTGILVRLPVEYPDVGFTKVQLGERLVEIDTESAVSQLDRYKMLMEHYVDHNCSITVQYTPEEVPEIVDWLMANWSTYVGVSFLLRQDVTRTAADLGFPYLPQEVVTESEYRHYARSLGPVHFDGTGSLEEIDTGPECSTGACPIR